MNNKQKRQILESTNGRVFGATFVKKDGTVRTINCRLGVTKHLRGGVSTTAHKTNLITVYDMASKGYRTINLDTLISAHVDGATIKF